MKKRRNKPYRPRAKNWNSAQMILLASSNAGQSDDVHRWLATEAYAGLEKLVSGLFTLRDFRALTKLCNFGHMLVIEVYPGLDDESRKDMDQHKAKMEQGAEALYSIAQRYEQTQRFGATGPELQALREAFSLMDTLTGYANRGESVRAMLRADQLTQTVIEKRNVLEPLANRSPDRAGSHEAGRA